jgi:hypothetical protein
VGFTWSERPLREGLAALGRDTSVAIFLDRRIDPRRRISFTARNVSLSEALKMLAAENELSLGLVGAVVYLGPKHAAARMQGLATMRKREAAALAGRSAWTSAEPIGWDELAEPRSIAQSIAALAHADISNPDAIPHDVWAGWSGPPVSPADQLTLVLAGFDLTFKLRDEGTELDIVAVPKDLIFEQTYTVSGSAMSAIAELKQVVPGATLQAKGSERIAVTGTAEQQAAVAEVLEGKQTTTKAIVKPGEKRYTLKVKNEPLGAIIRTVAKELDVEVKADQALIEKLKQRTSLEVKDLTAEQLLRKVLDPAGIQFKLSDESLELREKK